MAAVYRYVRLLAHDGVAVLETENRFGCETRTCDSPDYLVECFEEDGINAVLAAAGTDPERIRRETAVAMLDRESAPILELDQDRVAWGW